MMYAIQWYVSWYWLIAKQSALELWRDLPGPWYVKLFIVAICLAIPGPQDEILLIVMLRIFRAIRKRREA